MKKGLMVGAFSALAMYFFDPQQGRTRRAKLQDQVGGFFRRSARQASRKAQYARGQVEGMRHATTQESPPASDPALKDKIESEVLSRWNYPKGQINVSVAGGAVELRGTCESSDQISQLEQDVRKVTGVVDVRNYLHVPNTPPPNK